MVLKDTSLTWCRLPMAFSVIFFICSLYKAAVILELPNQIIGICLLDDVIFAADLEGAETCVLFCEHQIVIKIHMTELADQ